ncbi:hypothetical protein [Flagellimonas beolgyonensis]|uniref:hypothetical protein n=1 Tax=Flagellimonas beolgyonensis TaxID=864064 RepID=UPI000F8F3F12|nr:hypothetical protein [Allomuricauda beolgyonensis]
MKLHKINPAGLKKSIICKNVTSTLIDKSIKRTYMPKAGDVAIFRVKEIGKHTRIQTTNGNNRYILPGDLIMATFGNRYATEQLEGYVPTKYSSNYHILGQGGVVGKMASIHNKFELIGPTSLSLVGYVVDESGQVVNSKYLGHEAQMEYISPRTIPIPKVILSLGTSMDSGKTTSAAFLTRGLKLAKKKVAYIKLTGTAYTKDKAMVRDYGAKMSLDFSDFGFPSTYMCSTRELLILYKYLLEKAKSIFPDFIVVEIADGLLQRETAALLKNNVFAENVYGVLFSSADSISAISGANMLKELNYNIIGVTGLFTTSPLLVDEVRKQSEYKVLLGEDLMSKEIIDTLGQNIKPEIFENKVAANNGLC